MSSHGPELNKLHDIAHELLLNAEDELIKIQKATGKTPSELKRVRKALSNIDWNIQSYGDLIENSLAKHGYDHKPLQKAVRKMEEDTMKAYMLLSDDTIHHLVQQRTGGSLRTDPSVIRGAVRRLEDMFGIEFAQSTGPSGNVRGDLSFSNYAHKSDNNASGLERLTIPKNPDKSTTAHALGTSGFSKPLTAAELADEEALAKALAPRVKAQIDMAENAIITDSPRVQAVRSADPRLADAYKTTNTAEAIAAMQPIARSLELRPKIIQSYLKLVNDRGGMRLDFIPGAEEIGKSVARNPLEAVKGAALALDPDAVKSLFQGNPLEAINKSALGAGIGAGIAEMVKVSPVQQARLTSYASKIPGVASQLPKALSFIGGAARFVGPASTAVAGYQLADAILEGSTGAGFVDTIKQVQDKERTAEINKAAVESAKKSRQLAVEKELPKPIMDSDTIEKFATDPLNELEYGWKKLTGQI